jgi:hypothetical protein
MTAALAQAVILPREQDSNQYGNAQQLALLLTSPERPISADRVRDWARRSRTRGNRLHGMLPAVRVPGARTGTTWYLVRHAAAVERVTRSQCDVLITH